MIDYEQEYYNFLAANTFTQLPSKEVIETNERIALIVWANYQPKDRDDDDRDYTIALGSNYNLVSELYLPYANNAKFWKKVLTQESKAWNDVAKLLENESFLSHNKQAVAELKKDKDFFIALYEKNKEEQVYLDFLELSEEQKAPFIKQKILDKKYYYSIPYQEVEKYISDRVFLLELLKRGHAVSVYPNLPEELKRDKEIIFNAIHKNNWEMFLEIPKDLQEKYFNGTRQWDRSTLDLKTLRKFNIEQQKELLPHNLQIFKQLIEREPSIYLPIATEMVVKDINLINLIDRKSLTEIMKNPFLKEQIQSQITEFVQTFSHLEINSKQEHILKLIEKDEELYSELRKNIYYQIAKTPKGNLSQDKYFAFVDKIYNDYLKDEVNDTQAEVVLQKARLKLSIESLKELRLPIKGLFDRIKIEKLKQRLDENLPVSSVKSPSRKI